jgi:hypothetical protein
MFNNTMRTSYLKWRALEARLKAAREELNHQYLALLHKAEALQLETRLGLLHSASHLLNQPLDPQTFQLRQRLKHAFAILGKGFCRRSPTSLQLDILKYADRLEEICRHCHHLSVRLRLTQKVFDSLPRDPSRSDPQSFRLALSNPEAVWISLLLRQRRLLTHQIIDLSLARSWQTKLTVCQRWLRLLQSSLSPKTFRDFQNSLIELENQAGRQPGQEPFRSSTAHNQLDRITNLANQHAYEIIASEPSLR